MQGGQDNKHMPPRKASIMLAGQRLNPAGTSDEAPAYRDPDRASKKAGI